MPRSLEDEGSGTVGLPRPGGRFLRTASAVLLGLGALAGCGSDDPDGEGDSAADSVRREVREVAERSAADGLASAVPVRGARVRRDTFVLWVSAEGEASARRAATVSAEVGAPVEEVVVEEGDRVERGEVLVRLDTAALRLDVEAARARVEEARAQFRSMTLSDAELASDSLRRTRREQARVRSGLEQALVQLQIQERRLQAARVRAPFGGRAASVAASPGDRVSPGDSLLSVLDLSRIRVAVRVLENELPAVEVGRRVTARITAYPNRTFGGRVVSVNPQVDPESNTARVTVSLENPLARLVPGMHASVRVAGRLHEGRVFVPQEAIVERDRREVVFLFEPSDSGSARGRAQWQYVTTGLENERYVEIVPGDETEPLDPGRVVLTGGHATLAHDAPVRLQNADPLGLGDGGRP